MICVVLTEGAVESVAGVSVYVSQLFCFLVTANQQCFAASVSIA